MLMRTCVQQAATSVQISLFLLQRRSPSHRAFQISYRLRSHIGSTGSFTSGLAPLSGTGTCSTSTSRRRASHSRLSAAFKSRSMLKPHFRQQEVRYFNGMRFFTCPHPEQVLVEGKNRSTKIACPPTTGSLVSKNRNNWPSPASASASFERA